MNDKDEIMNEIQTKKSTMTYNKKPKIIRKVIIKPKKGEPEEYVE